MQKTILRSGLIISILTATLFTTSCGGDDKGDSPAPTKNVSVVITSVNAGSALNTNQTGIYTSTLGASSHIEYQTPGQVVTAQGENDEYNSTNRPTVTHKYPNFEKGQTLEIEVYFRRVMSPSRIQGNTSITAEVFVEGSSAKKVVVDASTTTYNPAGQISSKGSFTL